MSELEQKLRARETRIINESTVDEVTLKLQKTTEVYRSGQTFGEYSHPAAENGWNGEREELLGTRFKQYGYTIRFTQAIVVEVKTTNPKRTVQLELASVDATFELDKLSEQRRNPVTFLAEKIDESELSFYEKPEVHQMRSVYAALEKNQSTLAEELKKELTRENESADKIFGIESYARKASQDLAVKTVVTDETLWDVETASGTLHYQSQFAITGLRALINKINKIGGK